MITRKIADYHRFAQGPWNEDILFTCSTEHYTNSHSQFNNLLMIVDRSNQDGSYKLNMSTMEIIKVTLCLYLVVTVVARRPSLVVVLIPRCPRREWLGCKRTLESSFFSPFTGCGFIRCPFNCAGDCGGDCVIDI